MISFQQRQGEIHERFNQMFCDRITDTGMAEVISIMLAIAERSSMNAEADASRKFKQCVAMMMHFFNLNETDLEAFFIRIQLNGRPLN